MLLFFVAMIANVHSPINSIRRSYCTADLIIFLSFYNHENIRYETWQAMFMGANHLSTAMWNYETRRTSIDYSTGYIKKKKIKNKNGNA